jgi:acyl-CoA thioesterase
MRDDAALLGLDEVGDGRFRFVVAPHLSRMDGRLYGGTAIAASIVTAELVSDRRPLWMTTQFVSTVAEGAAVDVVAEVLAPGRRTNQVRVTGTSEDGATVFASLGATGHLREEGLDGGLVGCPTVAGPDEAEPWSSPFTGMARLAGIEADPGIPTQRGFTELIEMRAAEILEHPDDGPGRVCLWIRRRDREPLTPAMAAFAADMVPMSVAMAFGVVAGGTSLDNTIRVGDYRESEWVLLDLRPHGAAGDYGHGIAHVWSPDGHWLATASQTAAMRAIDLEALAAARSRRD